MASNFTIEEENDDTRAIKMKLRAQNPSSASLHDVLIRLDEPTISEEEEASNIQRKAYKGGFYAAVILTLMNLLNYMDRYFPSSVKDLVKEDLELTDAQTSLPLTTFLIVYMFTSPIFGILADRGMSRKLLIAIGVLTWSISTSLTFFAPNYQVFILFRTLVGVGEAAYATITPALLSDFYPPELRNRIFTMFYVAIPVGSAMGFIVGGFIGNYLGWRYTFLICGFPGILLVISVLFIQEPPRGTFDPDAKPASWKQIAGGICLTFAVGGIADWIPAYFHRIGGADIALAGLSSGAATVIGGIGGTPLGGYLADKLKLKFKNPYFLLCFTSLLPPILFTIVLLLVSNFVVLVLLLFVAQVFLWLNSGPINAILANSVPATIRTRAFSLQILLIHLLGDAISPLIIGAISDATGSLRKAAIIVPFALFLGSVMWGLGWYFAQENPNYENTLFNEEDVFEITNEWEIEGEEDATNKN